MPKSKIITIPNPHLRQPSQSVTLIDNQLKRGLTAMRQALLKSNGVGLAAPQIDWPKQIFATNLKTIDDRDSSQHTFIKNSDPIFFFFNPRLTNQPPKKILEEDSEGNLTLEGCLSLPGLYAPIPRYQWLEIEFEIIDPDNPSQFKTQKARFDNYFARNIQHEMDHLQGILFTDYLKNTSLPLYQNNPKTDQLEEIPQKNLIINSY